jgi:hypothetical protein
MEWFAFGFVFFTVVFFAVNLKPAINLYVSARKKKAVKVTFYTWPLYVAILFEAAYWIWRK